MVFPPPATLLRFAFRFDIIIPQPRRPWVLKEILLERPARDALSEQAFKLHAVARMLGRQLRISISFALGTVGHLALWKTGSKGNRENAG